MVESCLVSRFERVGITAIKTGTKDDERRCAAARAKVKATCTSGCCRGAGGSGRGRGSVG